MHKRNYFLISLLVFLLVLVLVLFYSKDDLSIRLAPNEVILNWVDASTNELGFIVERATDSNFNNNLVEACNVGQNIVSCSNALAWLTPATVYYFRVKSYNLYGSSAWIGPVQITTPIIISATCGDGTCNSGETCSSCVGDCGACPVTTGGSGGGGGGGGGGGSSGGSSTINLCGNRKINPNETCDDGNRIIGDGCSNACKIETGYTCNGLPSVCILSPSSNTGGTTGGSGGSSGGRDAISSQGNANAGQNSVNRQSAEEELENSIEKSNFKLVFWIILVLIITGILVVALLIIRTLRVNQRFEKLYSSSQKI